MRLQDAVDTFSTALRLTANEASIYVHLIASGPAKAGELANALKMHRNEVYRGTTRLLARGLVQMTLERPARFASVSPETAFETEMATRIASIEELRSARSVIFPLIHTLKLQPQTTKIRNHYKMIQGRQDIHVACNRIIEDAKRSLDWATTFGPSLALAEHAGSLETLQRKVASGTRARLILAHDADAWQRVAPLSHAPAIQMRALAAPSILRFIIRDHEELLMWVVHDPSESPHARDEVAILTTAPGFVQAEAILFEQSWTRAQPAPGVTNHA